MGKKLIGQDPEVSTGKGLIVTTCLGNTALGSSRLRSGGDRCPRELAIKVRWGTLPSGAAEEKKRRAEQRREARGEERAGKGRRGEESRSGVDIKSNNPHLTGGEQNPLKPSKSVHVRRSV